MYHTLVFECWAGAFLLTMSYLVAFTLYHYVEGRGVLSYPERARGKTVFKSFARGLAHEEGLYPDLKFLLKHCHYNPICLGTTNPVMINFPSELKFNL